MERLGSGELQGILQRLPITLLASRKRWKIENEGFNCQKNWQGDITHTCSWNSNVMKNHYLITQIADMVKQQYE